MTATRTKPAAPRQTKPAHASATIAGRTGEGASQAENAQEKRAAASAPAQGGQTWKNATQAKAEKAKAVFLEAIGHDCKKAPPGIVERKRALANKTGHKPGLCGFWWCGADAQKVSWAEMEKALDALREADIDPGVFSPDSKAGNIDPHGGHVAEFSYYHARARDSARERQAYAKLESALLGLKRSLPTDTNAEHLRTEWLSTVQTLLNAAGGSNASNRPEIDSMRRVVWLARKWKWDPRAVAAALVFVGAEPMDTESEPGKPGPFEMIVRKMRKAFNRYPEKAP